MYTHRSAPQPGGPPQRHIDVHQPTRRVRVVELTGWVGLGFSVNASVVVVVVVCVCVWGGLDVCVCVCVCV